MQVAVVGPNVPRAVRPLAQPGDPGETIDLRAEVSRRLRVRLRDAGGIDVTLERVVQRADEMPLVHQWEQPRGFIDRNDLHFEAQIAGSTTGDLQEVHPLRRSRKVDAAGDVYAARLSRDFLDLAIKLDGVFLQLGDVGIA